MDGEIETTSLGWLGVEVKGFDLKGDLSRDRQFTLRSLLDRHRLLLFRDQGLGAEDQVRVLKAFGPIFDDAGDGRRSSLLSEQPEESLLPGWRLFFHHDYAFTRSPLQVQSLYGVDVAKGAAPTEFVDCALAAAQLPEALRVQVEPLSAIHTTDRSPGRRKAFGRVCLNMLPAEADPAHYPRTAHPVLKQHSRTGEPLLFVSEQQTSHIENLTPSDSEALIERLFTFLYAPEHRLAHYWRTGDLVIWDNLALQHGRSATPTSARRLLRRVVVSDKTMAEMLRGESSIADRAAIHDESVSSAQISEPNGLA